MESQIQYFGSQVNVACDGNCSKAWGLNSRPNKQLSDNIDDIEWFSDGELGEAPIDPGTYEGADAKPISSDLFPNKWCVRECERCSMADLDKPIVIKSFEKRIKNIER